MKKIAKFFVSVKKEMKNVRWPSKKELITYSIATISFVIFFGLFFTLTDSGIALVRTLIG
ncbi:MAG: preprotein translocase subunit SecE [Bacilli bacterium]|nr:preprotein translocase subunit SecE [Bacilli bacterium]